MSDENKDLLAEQERVDAVIEEIQKQQLKLKGSKGDLKSNVIELRKTFWEDVTVSVDELDDVIETMASIKQQAELLSERERSHRSKSEQLKVLDRLEESPYFGRIDFKESGESEEEQIYIGIGSLMDEKGENFLIYDWRAPISSLYYDYPPGPAQYETIDGKIEGDLTLKRQFIIKNGKINGMFDTGLTIGDHLLQKVLGHNASTSMKSIVATIQREQNKIIRNEKAKLLIVQGVAGSGKTSAALQRVAFLLYRYRGSLTSENIMLFSPNTLFSSYVSSVLPELGEENMKQTTFQEHVEERLGSQFKIETPFDQMEYYLTGEQDGIYETRIASIRFKASNAFKSVMDKYLQELGERGMKFRNINFRNERVLSKKQIEKQFYSLPKSMSIPARLELVSEWILKELSKLEKEERKKDWVIEEAELLNKGDYVKAFETLEGNQAFTEESFDDFTREEKLLRKIVVARKLKPLKHKIENLQFVHMKEMYLAFFERSIENGGDFPKEWEGICQLTIEAIQNGKMFYEDVSPYLYFFDRIQGFTINKSIRHVLIDEAQDYSPFQLAYIKGMYPYARITLLGDFNQAIYAHALEAGTILDPHEEENHERIELYNSYRSTKEIVEFTKDILENGEVIRPFNREGTKPRIIQVSDSGQLHQEMEGTIQALLTKGYETVAVVCKSMDESKKVYDVLKDLFPIKLIGPNTKTYQKGIIIIPAYLAKGIEFDAVLIYNAASTVYKMEKERNLFYTACTRAMHELILFVNGEVSPFIQNISPDKYHIVKG